MELRPPRSNALIGHVDWGVQDQCFRGGKQRLSSGRRAAPGGRHIGVGHTPGAGRLGSQQTPRGRARSSPPCAAAAPCPGAGLPLHDARVGAISLLEEVKLLEAGSVRAGAYSGGMKRRLSVAIALLGDPKVGLHIHRGGCSGRTPRRRGLPISLGSRRALDPPFLAFHRWCSWTSQPQVRPPLSLLPSVQRKIAGPPSHVPEPLACAEQQHVHSMRSSRKIPPACSPLPPCRTGPDLPAAPVGPGGPV